jgi:Domain of unknown function (DUF4412)
MKRWSATLLVFAVCSAGVHADVTIVQKTTFEGGAAAMAPGTMPSPTTTNRIKGTKGRMDMDMGANSPIATNMSTITDAAAKQVIILDHNQKTARVSTAGEKPATPATAPTASIKFDGSITPTGKSQTIDGFKCDEYTFSTSMAMSDISGGSMPPEAAAMMKDITMVMKGSLWVTKEAPGAAEYLDYQKAITSADLASAALGATGVNMPGMDKMVKAMQGVQGVPILTEMDMSIEGSGQMADMMRQMGAMRITTKVLSVKTDAVSDDLFKVPQGYQVVK